MQLWNGKVIIGLCIIIGGLVGGAYLLQAKEKWTSTAIITQPGAAQIINYSSTLDSIYGNDAPSLTDVRKLFNDRFKTSFAAFSEGLNIQQGQKLSIEAVAIDPVRATNAAVKGNLQPIDPSQPLKITYTDSSAKSAQIGLENYIQQIDVGVITALNDDLAVTLKSEKTALQQWLKEQEEIAKQQTELRSKEISRALQLASQYKIQTPRADSVEHLSADNMFMLGSELLTEMQKKESNQQLVFSDNYYIAQHKLMDLTSLTVKNIGLHSYNSLMKPSLPTHRDSPNRAFIIVLSMFLGGMIGVGIILVRNVLKQYGYK